MHSYPYPDKNGWFGDFGGRFVAETLISPLEDLEHAYRAAINEESFWQDYQSLARHYVGRPSPTYHAKRLSDYLGGGQIYLKREDLNHTGAHKVNNVLGQVLLACRMGKKRLIAETGAGQHGVATAMLAAKFGLSCVVFMGEEDIKRQSPNVYRMKLLGAEVVSVAGGTRTLKDAMNEALRDWVSHIDDTYYVIGTVAGPHPYPEMVRVFQQVIGREAKQQIVRQSGKLPDYLVACVGGGSNAIGFFHAFLEDKEVLLIGVEAGGKGLNTKENAAPLTLHSPKGIVHGAKTYLMQDAFGQVAATHSISAGLDYPGVGPEHCLLQDLGRATYEAVNDEEAISAFRMLSRLEGIIPALESSHALAWAIKKAPQLTKEHVIFVNLSGRGDKDLNTIAQIEGITL